ncbi:hypothetical protein PN466_22780 [Roseofilum reptotaenium CS-1145]|uniref:Uncharacterized protein n=1 Tax=Roseofilum reptotaenium AO1-A TaxID=1925591 RepID=A0A1L9QMZ6_9CYAN|nr:hypothetical protein [Roseofilum reptotaenium]MDB9519773.1 hypothetical protein [Roseofilum reptotaenium CS-1145]OJJ24050.1 hypothetical protein BI308_18885 [Roseofilum reptotaenium AO1-A]
MKPFPPIQCSATSLPGAEKPGFLCIFSLVSANWEETRFLSESDRKESKIGGDRVGLRNRVSWVSFRWCRQVGKKPGFFSGGDRKRVRWEAIAH